MKNKSTKVFLVDDEFPMIEEFRQTGVYNSPISGQDLFYLAVHGQWNGHLGHLQKLIKDIVSSEAFKDGKVDLVGFNTPTKVLNEIDKGNLPDIVIYDWEYPDAPSHSPKSKTWLLEILSKTEAFVFVYSRVRNEIPVFLNKDEFSGFSQKFQLFLKGDEKSSIFSSEEFILQYILSKSTKTTSVRIQNMDIIFQDNGYLKDPQDILYLEKILGRITLSEKIEDGFSIISNKSIEDLLSNIQIKIFLDSERKILVTNDSNILLKKISISSELSVLDVLKVYGIKVLTEVLKVGVVSI